MIQRETTSDIGQTGIQTKDFLEIFKNPRRPERVAINFPPMYYTTTTNDSVHYKTNMEPVDDISIGDIIEMTRTGKEFLVESITPSGIILKECTTYVSFSRSALNERLKRNSAIHKSI